MATAFENILGLSTTQLVLTWVLLFTVSYASLLKTKALGENQKIIGVVSAVFAFFVVGFGAVVLGQFFQTLFGFSAFIIGGILVTILFIAMTGGDVSKMLGTGKVAAVLAAIAGIIFLSAAGIFTRGFSSDIVSTIFVVIILIIAVMFITGKNG